MNDIKNLTDKILEDAAAFAEITAKDARKQADEIIESYRLKADALLNAETEKAEKSAAELISRNDSSSKLRERNALLGVKAQMLDEAFSGAAEHFRNLPSDKYIELLLRFFKEAMGPGNMTICMNKKDLETVGKDFLAAAKEIFSKEYPGFSLTLSDEPHQTDGGFILKKGDIELNCSVSESLSACRQRYQNEIYKILFN